MRRGFTLMELMVTLSLIGIVCGLSISLITMHSDSLAVSELNTLMAACYTAQQLAYATHTQQMVYFEIKKNQYTYNNHVHHLTKPIVFGYTKDVHGPPSHPTQVINSPITFNKQCITFSPHGIIQSGTIYLKAEGVPRMYALTCGIAHTSFLRKYMFDGSWKLLR